MKVVVIGAGAAGLCCARHLSRYPDHFQVKVLEQSNVLGGTWVYTPPPSDPEPKNVHSSMYRNLRTNLPKEIMYFPGFSFPSHLPSFPYNYDVLKYLCDYASEYNLNRSIEFGTLVEKVTPIPIADGDGADKDTGAHNGECPFPKFKDAVRWRVTSRHLESNRKITDDYDAVLVCNGHFFEPNIPTIPGMHEFFGHVIHSHYYREPEVYVNKNILIIGSGQSGRDLLLDLSPYANKIYLCSRSHSISSTSAIPDNVEELPGIAELGRDRKIHFVDGQERHVDNIIMATGYLYSYPFLSEASGIRVDRGKRVTSLYKHTFNSLYPSMAFIGVNFGYNPFPYFDYQVRWVISVWVGDKLLPSMEAMARDEEEVYHKRLREGLPPHKAGHFLGSLQWDMLNVLAKLGENEPLDPVINTLYNEVSRLRTTNLMKYKTNNYAVLGPDQWVEVKKY